MKEVLIAFAPVVEGIGLVILGYLLSEYSIRRQMKEREDKEKAKEEKRLTEGTIIDAFKCATKADDIVSDVKRQINRALEIIRKDLDLNQAWPTFDSDLKLFTEKRAYLSQEFKINSFLLSRLDKKISDEFTNLLAACEQYFFVVNQNLGWVSSSQKPRIDSVKKILKKEFEKWRKLIIDFQNECLAIIGPIAPGRTLSAPEAKKEVSNVS